MRRLPESVSGLQGYNMFSFRGGRIGDCDPEIQSLVHGHVFQLNSKKHKISASDVHGKWVTAGSALGLFVHAHRGRCQTPWGLTSSIGVDFWPGNFKFGLQLLVGAMDICFFFFRASHQIMCTGTISNDQRWRQRLFPVLQLNNYLGRDWKTSAS